MSSIPSGLPPSSDSSIPAESPLAVGSLEGRKVTWLPTFGWTGLYVSLAAITLCGFYFALCLGMPLVGLPVAVTAFILLSTGPSLDYSIFFENRGEQSNEPGSVSRLEKSDPDLVSIPSPRTPPARTLEPVSSSPRIWDRNSSVFLSRLSSRSPSVVSDDYVSGAGIAPTPPPKLRDTDSSLEDPSFMLPAAAWKTSVESDSPVGENLSDGLESFPVESWSADRMFSDESFAEFTAVSPPPSLAKEDGKKVSGESSFLSTISELWKSLRNPSQKYTGAINVKCSPHTLPIAYSVSMDTGEKKSLGKISLTTPSGGTKKVDFSKIDSSELMIVVKKGASSISLMQKRPLAADEVRVIFDEKTGRVRYQNSKLEFFDLDTISLSEMAGSASSEESASELSEFYKIDEYPKKSELDIMKDLYEMGVSSLYPDDAHVFYCNLVCKSP